MMLYRVHVAYAAGDFGGDGYEDDYSPNDDMLGDIDKLDTAGHEAAGALRPWATGAVGMLDWMGGDAAAADGEMTYEELCRCVCNFACFCAPSLLECIICLFWLCRVCKPDVRLSYAVKKVTQQVHGSMKQCLTLLPC